jgi:hypothetical protein
MTDFQPTDEQRAEYMTYLNALSKNSRALKFLGHELRNSLQATLFLIDQISKAETDTQRETAIARATQSVMDISNLLVEAGI